MEEYMVEGEEISNQSTTGFEVEVKESHYVRALGIC